MTCSPRSSGDMRSGTEVEETEEAEERKSVRRDEGSSESGKDASCGMPAIGPAIHISLLFVSSVSFSPSKSIIYYYFALGCVICALPCSPSQGTLMIVVGIWLDSTDVPPVRCKSHFFLAPSSSLPAATSSTFTCASTGATLSISPTSLDDSMISNERPSLWVCRYHSVALVHSPP